MDYNALEPARFFLSLLPLLPLLPLLAVAVAAIIDIGREAWSILTGWPIGMSVDSTPALACVVDRSTGDSGGPLVRFLQEERACRAVETARMRGDVALTIRASIAWHNGDYGRAIALAGAACRVGR